MSDQGNTRPLDPRNSTVDPRDPQRDPRDPNQPPRIEEPAQIPVYKADEAATSRVGALLQIISTTRDLPKLKPLQDEAMAELEVLGEEARVRREKWNRDNAARDAEIARRKAALAAAQKAQAEIDAKKAEDDRVRATEATRQAALAGAPQSRPSQAEEAQRQANLADRRPV